MNLKPGKILTLVLVGGALAGVLSGCVSISLGLGDESKRMERYVQGYLDLTYKGEVTRNYLKETQQTEEEALARYEQGIETEVAFFQEAIGVLEYPTQEQTQQLTELYREIYQHSDYTVTSANKLDSGSYVVEVTVRPIDIMAQIGPDTLQALYEQALADHGITPQEQMEGMDAATYQQVDQVYAQQVIQLLEDTLPNIGNGAEESYIVHITMEGDTWTPAQKDLEAIDMAIIDYGSFGY